MKLSKRKGWIGLEGLKIQGSIGVYESEKELGNFLEVDLWVFGNLMPAISSDNLDDSINYEWLAKIAMEEIQGGNHLIEPVAYSILERIFKEIPSAEKAKIELRKLEPPVENPCEASAVKLNLKRKHLNKQ